MKNQVSRFSFFYRLMWLFIGGIGCLLPRQAVVAEEMVCNISIVDLPTGRNPGYYAMFEGLGLTIGLPPLGTTAGYWCDKLALRPYRDFWQRSDAGKWSDIVSAVFRSSFDLGGKSPEKVSEQIRKGIGDGMTTYAGLRQTLLSGYYCGFHIDVSTACDILLTLPAAPFLAVFSNELVKGATLDMSSLRQEMLLTTDISISYGRRFDLPSINNFFNTITGFYFDLSRSAVGVTTHMLLGHTFCDVTTGKASMIISPDGYSFSVDGAATLRTSGSGIVNLSTFDHIFNKGLTVSGFGIGFDGGIILYGHSSHVGLTLSRAGFIRWSGVKAAQYVIRGNGMDIEALIDSSGEIDFWQEKNNGKKSNLKDSLVAHDAVYMSQAATLLFEAGYVWQLFDRQLPIGQWVSPLLKTQINYLQGLSRRAGISYRPLVSIEGVNGLFGEHMPLRIGFGAGGYLGWFSSAGVGFAWRSAEISLNYQAIGSIFWYPRRGFQLSLNAQLRFPSIGNCRQQPQFKDIQIDCPIVGMSLK